MPNADDASLDLLFRHARTHNFWLDKPVDDTLLQQAYDLAKMAPTAANTQPLRIVFIKSQSAKDRLKPALDDGNAAKTMAAPVTAIIARDMQFHEHLPSLFPHMDARSWFVGNDDLIETTSFRSSTLQGAYFIIAARAVGLDCGPMSGFDNAQVDAAFFSGTPIKSNFLINLGYGDPAKLHPRNPRLDFDKACKII